MANKFQKKSEYAKPYSLSLKPSDRIKFKVHSKRNGLSFSEMLRILFKEEIDYQKRAITLSDQLKIDKKFAQRMQCILIESRKTKMINDENVKPSTISLKPSDHKVFKEFAKSYTLTFSEMVRILFNEDINHEENATKISQQIKRHKLMIIRLKQIKRRIN